MAFEKRDFPPESGNVDTYAEHCLPEQYVPSVERLYPGSHTHWKLPTVLAQRAFRQIPLCSHSSMSAARKQR